MAHATGTFDVTLTPQPATDDTPLKFLGRLNIDKSFSGQLQANSEGQMLAAGTPTEGSAGYVALEHVSGTLDGQRGMFVLQHSGHASRGENTLTINVVADSGTDDLTGLSGAMSVTVDDAGVHSYEFDYQLLS